jgi:hypothetical protein
MVLGMDKGGAKGPFRPTIERNYHSSPSKVGGYSFLPMKRRTEARNLLFSVYGGFTEGWGTPILQDA